MKGLKKFLKPTFFNIFFALIISSWQYFYSFQSGQFEILNNVRNYLSIVFGMIDWENYIMRAFSLLLIWIFVALVIFVFAVTFESLSVAMHNRKVQARFVNQQDEDFTHLLKSREITLKRHFLPFSLYSAAFMMTVFAFSSGADILESIRFSAVDSILLGLLENGVEINFNSQLNIVVSYGICFLVWYLFGSGINFLFKYGQEKNQEEKDEEEHFGAVIEDAS